MTLDNDGRLDAVVMAQNEPLIYLHNQTDNRGHFISLALEGTRSNRDGVGARVTIHAGGRRQVAQRYGGGSYQSAGDPRIHFGLGDATSVESVEIRWPSGSGSIAIVTESRSFLPAPAKERQRLTGQPLD